MKTSIEKDYPITEIVETKSPYDELKMQLKKEIVAFSEEYPLSTEESIHAYIDLVLRKNYGKILKVIPERKSAWYHFGRLQMFLRGVAKRTIKKVLEFYENQYMALLEEDFKDREMAYYDKVRKDFITVGLDQD